MLNIFLYRDLLYGNPKEFNYKNFTGNSALEKESLCSKNPSRTHEPDSMTSLTKYDYEMED